MNKAEMRKNMRRLRDDLPDRAEKGAMIAAYGAGDPSLTFRMTGLPAGCTVVFRRTNETDTRAEILRFVCTDGTCGVTLPSADDEIWEIELA